MSTGNQRGANGPVGIMDSGVGGLSVLQEVRRLLPAEDLLYVADSGNAPYGERDRAFVERRADALTRFLVSRGAKAIVVACNTATEMAIETLRARYDLPIVGTEPAIKTAVSATKTGVVGVLATRGTVNGQRVATLIERHGQRAAEVLLSPCPELVACVEDGRLSDAETLAAIRARVEPLVTQRADVIVLGCTHFHFLKPAIERAAGSAVTVIDSGAAVARQLQRRLAEAKLLNSADKQGSVTFWTTGDVAKGAAVFATLLGTAVDVLPLAEA